MISEERNSSRSEDEEENKQFSNIFRFLDERRNAPPHYRQIICEGPIPNGFNHRRYVGISSQKDKKSKYNLFYSIREFLNGKEFKSVKLDLNYFSDYFNSEDNETFVGAFFHKETSQFLFLNVQEQEEESLEGIIFASYPCKLHESALRENKWNYPEPYAIFGGRYGNLTEMSWNYIDVCLHCRPHYEPHFNRHHDPRFNRIPIDHLRKALFKNIRKHGLEKLTTRVSITFKRRDRLFLFNTVYRNYQTYKVSIIHDAEDIPNNNRIEMIQTLFQEWGSS